MQVARRNTGVLVVCEAFNHCVAFQRLKVAASCNYYNYCLDWESAMFDCPFMSWGNEAHGPIKMVAGTNQGHAPAQALSV